MKSKRFIRKGAVISALLFFSLLNAGYAHKLTKELGRVHGSWEVETWYNLPMGRVIENMRKRGYCESDYPFWIREDGVKMLGDFVMVAADLNKYPRGSVVYTTLGQGLVCDTGEDLSGFDIAVIW